MQFAAPHHALSDGALTYPRDVRFGSKQTGYQGDVRFSLVVVFRMSAQCQRAIFAVDEGLRVPKRGTGYGQTAGLLGSVLLKCWAVTGIRERLSSLAAGRQSIRAELMYIKANAVNLISGIDRAAHASAMVRFDTIKLDKVMLFEG